jgi:hypothetical protein
LRQTNFHPVESFRKLFRVLLAVFQRRPHPASSGVLVDELDAGGVYASLKTLIKFQFVLPTCNL